MKAALAAVKEIAKREGRSVAELVGKYLAFSSPQRLYSVHVLVPC